MENAIKPVKIFVLPGWIHRSLLRNNLNTVDVSDYAKMRKILSIEDFAEWVQLNDIFKLDNQAYVSTTTLDQLFNSSTLTKDQIVEYRNSVLPLSGTDDIAKTTLNKLCASNSMSKNACNFIATGDNNFVVLNEGFINSINTKESKLDFIRKYLEFCYSLYSVKRVSLTSIYDLYVKLV
jgi:hypothetical protein